MLIRFTVKNFLSFKEETEFNLLPGRTKKLAHHKYKCGDIEVLKMTALYGANASGKSNLITAMWGLKKCMTEEALDKNISDQKFLLSEASEKQPIEFAIEFTKDDFLFYYAIAINDDMITEEYFTAKAGSNKEVIVFDRKIVDGKTVVIFSKEFETGKDNQLKKKIITENLLKENHSLFFLLNKNFSGEFRKITIAYKWVINNLQILFPTTKPMAIVKALDGNPMFRERAKKYMNSYSLGVNGLHIKSRKIMDHDELSNEVFGSFRQVEDDLLVSVGSDDEAIVVKTKDGLIERRLFLTHDAENETQIALDFFRESEGTKRLLQFFPMFDYLFNGENYTFIIDEIEQSIHPLMMKEIIKKFANDESSKGQLIFSTHDVNLLDQEIFRQDEIWFAEKNAVGASRLYPLSDYKEHATIDIEKGYLAGRYGGVPYLGDLRDLNWNMENDD